jgi:hypothetical protein
MKAVQIIKDLILNSFKNNSSLLQCEKKPCNNVSDSHRSNETQKNTTIEEMEPN